MAFLINNRNDVVTEFIEGLAEIYPNLLYLDGFPAIKVVVRADVSQAYDKVSVISGGGSGHEPAHAGYVGEGMLTAAICGDVFASPPVDAILAGIRAVTGTKGCLLIVKNYIGDRLNFGLAAEQAKSEGYKVEMVIVEDDCALPPPQGIAGRRGLAGTILVHKVAGAAAAAGLPLDDVVAEAKNASKLVGTMGVALSVCTLPGQIMSDRLGPGKLELGLGIEEWIQMTGTTVIAFMSPYGILLLHDGLLTSPSILGDVHYPCETESESKYICIYANIHCVSAGNVKFVTVIRNFLIEIASYYGSLYNSIPRIEYLCQRCLIQFDTEEFREAFPSQGAMVILAAMEDGIQKLHSFVRARNRMVWERPCISWECFGTGSRFARPVLESFVVNPKTKLRHYEMMLKKAVVKASEQDPGTGGQIQILLLTSDDDIIVIYDEDIQTAEMDVNADETARIANIKDKKKKEAKMRRRQQRKKKNRKRAAARKRLRLH